VVRILLIEDDAETQTYLASGLREEGYQVCLIADGRDALVVASAQDFDLLIIDRMLPGLDGLSVVKALRASGVTSPVLFLGRMSDINDRVTSLNAGGDDYLVKPFAFAELSARVAALGRRPRGMAVETAPLRIADLEVDVLSRVVRRGGREISLQPREFRLLEYLMRHVGQVVTRTMLLDNVWNYHSDPKTNVVESQLSRLRTKVDKGFAVELIHTVRGSGYCIRAPK
jgi:two-component system OmpR family response regulator